MCYPLPVAARVCSAISPVQRDSSRVSIEAETLYEAATLGLARLKADGWVEGPGPGTKLEIHVRQPATSHVVSVQQLQRWMNCTNSSPAETLRKAKLKNLLKV